MFGFGRSKGSSSQGNQGTTQVSTSEPQAGIEEPVGDTSGASTSDGASPAPPASGTVSIAVDQTVIDSKASEPGSDAADFANMSAAEASLRRKQQARSPKEPGSKLSTIFGKIFESRSFTAGDSVANFMAGEHPMVLFSGDPKKVVAYDDERLTKWGWMWALQGTVLHLRSFWIAMVFYWGWAVFAGVIVNWANGDATLAQRTETANTFNSVSNIINVLLGFILGLYQSEAIARWWTVVNEGVFGISAALQDNVMYCAAYLTDEHSPEIMDAKKRIILYCKYALVFAIRQCAGHDKQFQNLLATERLDDEERMIIETHTSQAHNLIWGWLIATWTSLYSRNLLPGAEESLQNAIGACQDGRKATALVDRYVNVQIPYEYYHLLVLVAKLFLIFFSMAQGITLQIKAESEEWFQFVISSFVLFIVPCFYEGLLIIMYEIRNPFSDHPSDLDLDRLVSTLNGQIESYTVLPSSILPKHHLKAKKTE